ncbi:MAG: exo-alpha-sialidase [candidate division WOR-3 bacterium]
MVTFALLLLADWPWITNVRVDDATGATDQNETAFSPFGGGWNDYRTGSWRYGFSGSTDQGATWMTNQMHHYTSGRAHDCDPVIGTDANGRLHEIILNFDYSYNGTCVHRSSTDMGVTWSGFHAVSINGGVGLPDKPWMAFSPTKDTIYACYVLFYGANDGTYAVRSTDGGNTWNGQKISTSGTSSRPFICVDKAGNVYVVWLEWYSKHWYLSYSTNGGTTWSTPRDIGYVTMNPDHRPSQIPWLMGGSAGTIYMTWPDERYSSTYQYDVLFSRSTDYGTNWTTPVAVNTLTGRGHKAFLPSIALTPYGDLVMVWAQYKGSQWSVEYAYSLDGGATWQITPGATGRVSDVNFSMGYGQTGMEMGDYMTAYADSDYVYALWADDRTGDYKIYFSKAFISDLIPTSTREDAARAELGIKQIAGGFVLTLAGNSSVSVEIYDPAGRLVSEAFRGTLEAGDHAFAWPSLNQGVYLSTVQVGDRRTSLKFTAR